MAWSSPTSWRYNGHDIITDEYMNVPGEAVATSELASAAAQVGISVAALDDMSEAMTLSAEQIAVLLYGDAAENAKLVNFPPPADAKEWTCQHGFDALYCTLCLSARKRWEAFAEARETIAHRSPAPVAAPPKRRAMTLTGDVPA